MSDTGDGDSDGDNQGLELPGEGGLDMSALLAQAQQMQEQLMQAQAEAAEQIVQGHAGGGVVTVEVTGGMDFQKITIDPKAVDPADVEMLEDLILAAIAMLWPTCRTSTTKRSGASAASSAADLSMIRSGPSGASAKICSADRPSRFGSAPRSTASPSVGPSMAAGI